MILVALMAVTRKVVILDAKKVDPLAIFGIGLLVLSLARGYYLLREASRAGRQESVLGRRRPQG